VPPRAKGRDKKKKVFKIVEEKGGAIAKEVDFSKFAETLHTEVRRQRVAKRKRKVISIVGILKAMGRL
jgi:hypothetical protein